MRRDKSTLPEMWLRAGVAVWFFSLPATLPQPTKVDRTYHPVSIGQLYTTKWTHVEVEGRVTLVKQEDDGDVHIRLEPLAGEQGTFCVAEILPTLHTIQPIQRPQVGQVVRVHGISRIDRDHGWSEVHPVESLVVVPVSSPVKEPK